MKLRIHAGSVRLRLKQSEVKALAEGREVTEVCPTLPVGLRYTLRPDAAAAEMTCTSDGAGLTVLVPAGWVAGWDVEERVGFHSESGGVAVLIEKDYKCAHPATEIDNEDCYENPVACG
jgi:hypothetical protein